jgi:subtilisin family serine protease
MNPLDLVKLTALMERSGGRPEIVVGLIDGPVVIDHAELMSENIRKVPGRPRGVCAQTSSTACLHGTFVAGILCAKRSSSAPAICPNCTLLVCPIFGETASEQTQLPNATPQELATAILGCIEAGARVLNLSVALAQPSVCGERVLAEALDYAAQRGVLVVAAAGNQGTLGSSVITRHSWVIPVVACDLHGRPSRYSNLGSSSGRRGLSAPGEAITSLATEGKSRLLGGTSVAAPFVTGTIALLWSEFPIASAAQIKLAVTRTATARRTTVVPPILDAWGAYQAMQVDGRR